MNCKNSLPFAFLSFFLLILTIPTYSQSTDKNNKKGPKLIRGGASNVDSSRRVVKRRSITLERSDLAADSKNELLGKETFALINLRRLERGLPELIWNQEIADLARRHSENMAVYGFFSHMGKNGRLVDSRADDSGINKWDGIGENIAFNKGFENPTGVAVERWMLSKGHKLNLLDPIWKESGLGIAVTKDGKYFFTQIFIYRK